MALRARRHLDRAGGNGALTPPARLLRNRTQLDRKRPLERHHENENQERSTVEDGGQLSCGKKPYPYQQVRRKRALGAELKFEIGRRAAKATKWANSTN